MSSASVGSPERAARIFWAIVRGGSPARARIGRCVLEPQSHAAEARKVPRGARSKANRVLSARQRQRAPARDGLWRKARPPARAGQAPSEPPRQRRRATLTSGALAPSLYLYVPGNAARDRRQDRGRRGRPHHGLEGIAVESYARDDAAFDITTIGIEFGVVLGSIKRAAESLEAGKTHEIAIGTEKMITLIRTLGETYFLAARAASRRQPRQGPVPDADCRAEAPRRARMTRPERARKARLRAALPTRPPRAARPRASSASPARTCSCSAPASPTSTGGTRSPEIHARLERRAARAGRRDRHAPDQPRGDPRRLDRRRPGSTACGPAPQPRRLHAHVDRDPRRALGGGPPLRRGAPLEPRRA